MSRKRGGRSQGRPVGAAEESDPHLRLPPALRLARMAEMAFLVVTAYFALVVPGEGTQAEHVVRVRLVFEAFVAMALLLIFPRRPAPVRVAAMVFAVFVLVGCVPGLVVTIPALGGASSAQWLSFVLQLAACAAQAVVLVACLTVRGMPRSEFPSRTRP